MTKTAQEETLAGPAELAFKKLKLYAVVIETGALQTVPPAQIGIPITEGLRGTAMPHTNTPAACNNANTEVVTHKIRPAAPPGPQIQGARKYRKLM